MVSSRLRRVLVVATAIAAILGAPPRAFAHPMGNFSISHYAGIRIERDVVRLRYLIDMAEIPAFQEIQASGIAPEPNHPGLPPYLARTVEAWTEGLWLEVDGRRLTLRPESSDIGFPPGAGGLPTLKVSVTYRATLPASNGSPVSELRYRDTNFRDRAGWKEIVAAAGAGATLTASSMPERDRSRELSDYPTDLLESPPQDLAARVLFTRETIPAGVARTEPAAPGPAAPRLSPSVARPESARLVMPGHAPRSSIPPAAAEAPPPHAGPIRSAAARPATPRNAFTELVATREMGLTLVLFATAVAAALGAFHALEPGHGKTVVAAYLVGSRGTARHAVILGLIVTASHTAGVYLLGAVTLYASRYVVPERLYPWLGLASGLTIAVLGVVLFLRRYTGAARPHAHGHRHGHAHDHGEDGHVHHHDDPDHPHGDRAADPHHHRHTPDGTVSLRELLALGVTGGIVPCPAALVVLLSAVALRRVGFGLLLIAAFSVGLAAALVGVGLLMVYARRFMARFDVDGGEGRVITRWLPLTSAAVITLSGVVVAVQALMAAGILTL